MLVDGEGVVFGGQVSVVGGVGALAVVGCAEDGTTASVVWEDGNVGVSTEICVDTDGVVVS